MRDFKVIENEKLKEKSVKKSVQTNPIAKKFVEFHHENPEKFSVKDLFKK